MRICNYNQRCAGMDTAVEIAGTGAGGVAVDGNALYYSFDTSTVEVATSGNTVINNIALGTTRFVTGNVFDLRLPATYGIFAGGNIVKNNISKWKPGTYAQQYVHGQLYSAVFISTDSGTYCIGACYGLVKTNQYDKKRFIYAGNIGPVTITNELSDWLQKISTVLCKHTELRGIWGIDFIESVGKYYLIEVNPRYTSSIEVHEKATGRTLIRELLTDKIGSQFDTPSTMIAKGTYYSQKYQTISNSFFDTLIKSEDIYIHYTDIPSHKTTFNIDDPVLTILAYGENLQQCQKRLQQKILHITQSLDLHQRIISNE